MAAALLLFTSRHGHSITELPNEIWSDSGRCAYDSIVIVVRPPSEVWVAGFKVDPNNLLNYVLQMGEGKRLDCIIVLGQESIDIDSPAVLEIDALLRPVGHEIYFHKDTE